MVDHLEHLEAQSIYILREARSQLRNLLILWSVGKDSNVLLWLARKAFIGRVPFPVALLDELFRQSLDVQAEPVLRSYVANVARKYGHFVVEVHESCVSVHLVPFVTLPPLHTPFAGWPVHSLPMPHGCTAAAGSEVR